MWNEWSTLKKLIFLKAAGVIGSSPSWVWQLLTGTAPLTLLDAVAHPIHSLKQYGLCVQDGTPTPPTPMDIVCNNGVLRYGALGANLFDPSPSAILLNYYRNSTTGDLTPSNPNFISAGYIPVKPNTSYVLVGRAKSDNKISAWNRIYWFDASKEFIRTCSYRQDTVTVATSPANAAYAQYGINYNNSNSNVLTQADVDSYNWTFCEGTAEPATFVPFVGGIYTDGEDEVLTVSADGAETQTLTGIPMLLSTGAGGAADEWDAVGGNETHKVGVKVFDGTETFTVSSSGSMITTITGVAVGARNVPLNTHFALETSPTSLAAGTQRFGASGAVIYSSNYYMKHPTITTVADFKAWLAAQYAAGTPVIALYPLSTEQTEQGAAHALHTSVGTNVIDVSAEVSPVQLSVEYAKQSA